MLKASGLTNLLRSPYRKKLFWPGCLCILLLGAFTGSLLYINGQGSRAAITEQEIIKEQAFVNQYKNEERKLKMDYGYLAEPTEANQVEKVQNELLQKLKGFQLTIGTITKSKTVAKSDPNQPKPEEGTKKIAATITDELEYELTFSGTWENTVTYIQQMQSSAGLLAVQNVSMKPKANETALLDTSIKYTIYLR